MKLISTQISTCSGEDQNNQKYNQRLMKPKN